MLITVTDSNISTFNNLRQQYEAESSFYSKKQPQINGLYSFHHELNENREAYLIIKDELPVGFALLEISPINQILDFYVIPLFRRNTLGMQVCISLFEKHPGDWEIFQPLESKDAVNFWKHIVKAQTKGLFEETTLYDNRWNKASKLSFRI